MNSDAVQLTVLERTDCERLKRFFYRLSPQTRYRRFLGPVVRLEQVQAQRFLDVDHHDREAVIAVLEDEIVGVARYARLPKSGCAEIAVVVEDAWQRSGIGTRMVRGLQILAWAAEIRKFSGLMHAENRPVILFLRSLFPAGRFRLESELIEVEISL